jgi:hypothetical protein
MRRSRGGRGEDIEAIARNRRQVMATDRAKLTIPADPSITATLAVRYDEPKLGAIEFRQVKGVFVLDAASGRARLSKLRAADYCAGAGRRNASSPLRSA